eukprot:6192650-Pleurochrysis_carterae.AAC.1
MNLAQERYVAATGPRAAPGPLKREKQGGKPTRVDTEARSEEAESLLSGGWNAAKEEGGLRAACKCDCALVAMQGSAFGIARCCARTMKFSKGWQRPTRSTSVEGAGSTQGRRINGANVRTGITLRRVGPCRAAPA